MGVCPTISSSSRVKDDQDRLEVSVGRDPSGLDLEFTRIKESHRQAVRETVARMSLPGSITRVFKSGTKADLMGALLDVPVDELPSIRDEKAFQSWFEKRLEIFAEVILERNRVAEGSRIHPGYKWGHGAKVLSVYLHNLVSYSRYFTDEEAAQIEPLLCCPIDGLALERLTLVGARQDWTLIRELHSSDAYWRLQDTLAASARRAGVPRVWFDDNWGSRSEEKPSRPLPIPE